MAYDHEEQEQLDVIKHWWKRHGNWVSWLVILVLAVLAGMQGWKWYHGKQVGQAAQLYVQVQKAAEAGDDEKVQRAAADMVDRFGSTMYAEFSALIAAKSSYDKKDLSGAAKHLQWVVDNGEEEFRAIAAVRLAGVLMDEKSYDAALKVLSGKYAAQFESMIADRRGDVLVAQDKREDARAAYALALEKAGREDPARQLIQLKLDAIGGAPSGNAA